MQRKLYKKTFVNNIGKVVVDTDQNVSFYISNPEENKLVVTEYNLDCNDPHKNKINYVYYIDFSFLNNDIRFNIKMITNIEDEELLFSYGSDSSCEFVTVTIVDETHEDLEIKVNKLDILNHIICKPFNLIHGLAIVDDMSNDNEYKLSHTISKNYQLLVPVKDLFKIGLEFAISINDESKTFVFDLSSDAKVYNSNSFMVKVNVKDMSDDTYLYYKISIDAVR